MSSGAANNATALQKEMWDKTQANQAPWLAAGTMSPSSRRRAAWSTTVSDGGQAGWVGVWLGGWADAQASVTERVGGLRNIPRHITRNHGPMPKYKPQ